MNTARREGERLQVHLLFTVLPMEFGLAGDACLSDSGSTGLVSSLGAYALA